MILFELRLTVYCSVRAPVVNANAGHTLKEY